MFVAITAICRIWAESTCAYFYRLFVWMLVISMLHCWWVVAQYHLSRAAMPILNAPNRCNMDVRLVGVIKM